MMQILGQYVAGLTAAAMLCGILLSLVPEGTVKKLLRLVCGITLTVSVLGPLPGIRLPDFSWAEGYLSAGETMAARGSAMAAQERCHGIKQALDAYILDKAAALGISVRVETAVDDEGMPVAIALQGHWTAQNRQTLADIITKDLGIPEEDQQWTKETYESVSGNGSPDIGGLP